MHSILPPTRVQARPPRHQPGWNERVVRAHARPDLSRCCRRPPPYGPGAPLYRRWWDLACTCCSCCEGPPGASFPLTAPLHFSSHFFFLFALLPPPAAAGRLPPLAVLELLPRLLGKGVELAGRRHWSGPLAHKEGLLCAREDRPHDPIPLQMRHENAPPHPPPPHSHFPRTRQPAHTVVNAGPAAGGRTSRVCLSEADVSTC